VGRREEDLGRGRARELTLDLRYPAPQANKILGGALAIYLDDRFSITERRQLGWGEPGQSMVVLDFDGNPRPVPSGTTADSGAFEAK
jgi:hypothetical protein